MANEVNKEVICGTSINPYHVSNQPKLIAHASSHCRGDAKVLYIRQRIFHRRDAMGLILLLVALVLLFGGVGFYMGAPYNYYGGGLHDTDNRHCGPSSEKSTFLRTGRSPIQKGPLTPRRTQHPIWNRARLATRVDDSQPPWPQAVTFESGPVPYSLAVTKCFFVKSCE